MAKFNVSHQHSFKRVASVFALMCSSIFLTSCSQSLVEDSLSNYLSRLFRVISLEPPRSLPHLGEIRLRVPEPSPDPDERVEAFKPSISLLDFLSLYGCELQLVVAKKNSGLGRLSRSSQALLSELEFLDYAPDCIAALEDEPELRATLEAVVARKKSALPQALARTLLGGDEARSFWKIPGTLGDYPQQVGPDLVIAIKQLNEFAKQWLTGNYDSGRDQLEKLLARLNVGEGGQLYAALSLYAQILDVANNAIAANAGTFCVNQRSTLDQDILDNVVRKYFIGDVQQWASVLGQRYYSVIKAYDGLESTLTPYLGSEYLSWKQQRDETMRTSLETSRAHVRNIKKLSSPCEASSFL